MYLNINNAFRGTMFWPIIKCNFKLVSMNSISTIFCMFSLYFIKIFKNSTINFCVIISNILNHFLSENIIIIHRNRGFIHTVGNEFRLVL